MKMTKEQERVMKYAKLSIDQARTMTYDEWLLKVQDINASTNPELAQALLKHYENDKKAIVSTHCNSKTLEKLQALGLIEIIHDSKNDKTSYGIDKIKVLNY